MTPEEFIERLRASMLTERDDSPEPKARASSWVPTSLKGAAQKAAEVAQDAAKHAGTAAETAGSILGDVSKEVLAKAPSVLQDAKAGAAEFTTKASEVTRASAAATADVAADLAGSLSEKGRAALKTGSKKLLETSRTVASRTQEAWIVTSATVGEATQAAGDLVGNTEWMRSINGHWDKDPLVKAITQSMDKAFKAGDLDLATGLKVMPNNHRLLVDGHTLRQSLTHAYEVAADQGTGHLETTVAWMKAYVEDLSSPAGMPIGEWSKHVYATLRKAGWDEAAARNLVTVNGSEAVDALLSGTLSALSVALAWTTQDREDFSRAIGALGMAAMVSVNPVTGLVTIVAVAIAYKRDLLSKNAVQKGAFVKLAGFSVSLLLPGPAIVTAVCGIVVAVYLNKNLDAVQPLSEQLAAITKASYMVACSQLALITEALGSIGLPSDLPLQELT